MCNEIRCSMDKDIQAVEASDFFGKVQRFRMPLEGVYQIIGSRDDGYTVTDENCELELSQSELSHGVPCPGGLHMYGEKTADIISYELCRFFIQQEPDDDLRPGLFLKMQELEKFGAADHPDVFGEYPPPARTPDGVVTDYRRIRNGMFFARSTEGDVLLAICDPVGSYELTMPARERGELVDDKYLFYRYPDLAAPLYELKSRYAELENLICSPELLLACLNKKLPDYVEAYNLYAVAGTRIAKCSMDDEACRAGLNWPVF